MQKVLKHEKKQGRSEFSVMLLWEIHAAFIPSWPMDRADLVTLQKFLAVSPCPYMYPCSPKPPPCSPSCPDTDGCAETVSAGREGEVWKAGALHRNSALAFSKVSLQLLPTCQLLPAVGYRGFRITNACTRASSQSPIRTAKETGGPARGSREGGEKSAFMSSLCRLWGFFGAKSVSTNGMEAGLGCLTQCFPKMTGAGLLASACL